MLTEVAATRREKTLGVLALEELANATLAAKEIAANLSITPSRAATTLNTLLQNGLVEHAGKDVVGNRAVFLWKITDKGRERLERGFTIGHPGRMRVPRSPISLNGQLAKVLTTLESGPKIAHEVANETGYGLQEVRVHISRMKTAGILESGPEPKTITITVTCSGLEHRLTEKGRELLKALRFIDACSGHDSLADTNGQPEESA